jgi:O-antigen ligase
VLSFRRTFWIGAVLGVMLVLALGLSPVARRLVLPLGALVLAAVWLLASVGFESQAPIFERVRSLEPSRIQQSAEDRYRFDERANVVAELRDSPVLGIGVGIPWSSAARPLPVEHENGRGYVHTTALWYWLKLGLLGLAAYVAIMVSALALAWRVWRRHAEAPMRAFGLTALATLLSVAVIETAGSFTGVDVRFTAVFGVLLGLLAVLARELDLPEQAA